MSDLRLEDVVDSTDMIGPVGEYCQATCLTCSQQYKVTREEFRFPTEKETLRYVATMRAWNCCHEGQEPIDGLPQIENERVKLYADQ